MTTKSPGRRLLRLAITAAASLAVAGAAAAAEKLPLPNIFFTQAQSLVDSGQAPGVAVAVLDGDNEPVFFTYGNARAGGDGQPAVPFRPDMPFEIASNTKLFTTNLLGQRVASGALDLDQPLSDFSAQTGPLRPFMGRVKLKELGDFTAGIASTPKVCETRQKAICMPNDRPTIEQYPAQSMARYFQAKNPMDFSGDEPVRALRLPAPYFYSNFSVGMLGLLMGGPAGQPITNDNIFGWFDAVKADVLQPLRMNDTVLYVPENAQASTVQGYNRATAHAVVSTGGGVSGVEVVNHGSYYGGGVPQVTISGGGGAGATAVARVMNGSVSGVTVVEPGAGYMARPQVIFTDGGSTLKAEAEVVVADGKVKGVRVKTTGRGYQNVPTVTITGGRLAGGRDATAMARIANGAVVYVSVEDRGEGYVDPLTVSIAPGAPISNVVTAWAPAGGLKSTLQDMAKFASAAMGREGTPGGVLAGFEVAQRAYACQSDLPSLKTCEPDQTRMGLAWQISRGDQQRGTPRIVSKSGALPGYWSAIALMPARGLGVVAFMNSYSFAQEKIEETSVRLAEDVLYALYFERCAGSPRASRQCQAGR